MSALESKPRERVALPPGQDGPSAFGDRRRQTRHALGPIAGEPADGVQDALQVVGGFAGLEHRDGDIDERLERRQRLDRPGRIDRVTAS